MSLLLFHPQLWTILCIPNSPKNKPSNCLVHTPSTYGRLTLITNLFPWLPAKSIPMPESRTQIAGGQATRHHLMETPAIWTICQTDSTIAEWVFLNTIRDHNYIYCNTKAHWSSMQGGGAFFQWVEMGLNMHWQMDKVGVGVKGLWAGQAGGKVQGLGRHVVTLRWADMQWTSDAIPWMWSRAMQGYLEPMQETLLKKSYHV